MHQTCFLCRGIERPINSTKRSRDCRHLKLTNGILKFRDQFCTTPLDNEKSSKEFPFFTKFDYLVPCLDFDFIPQIRKCLQLKLFFESQTDTVSVDRSLSFIKSSKRFWPFSAKWRMSSFALFGTMAEDTRLFSGDGREKGFPLQCVSID